MHDFCQLVDDVRHKSFDGDERRYHRFRYSSHDDTVVADCIGSNLRCAHEWGWCEGILDNPTAGRFYTPETVTEKLLDHAEEHGCDTARISGMEPVMQDDHLVKVARRLDSQGMALRVDTNGMLLDHSYLQRLEQEADLSIRLSFKGHHPASFQRLADVHRSWFTHQHRAFLACRDSDVDMAAVLAGVYTEEQKDELTGWLGVDDDSIDLEPLHLCPANRERLEAAGFDLDHILG